MINGKLIKKEMTWVNQIIADGDEIPVLGGVVVIHTRGHTPGHISLYLKQSKTLIAGDAFMIEEGYVD
ncbi:Metallo-beta-lactamase superfamily protein [Cohnella sp. OV330]|nr:Metallo-beta-lactamase superfamily protein [Cohnella sp. OV330]